MRKRDSYAIDESDLLQEISQQGRLLDMPNRRSMRQSNFFREETKPVYSRDDHELLLRALKRLSSSQVRADFCKNINQAFKDIEKNRRQSTRPSPRVAEPMSCSKQEQIIQEQIMKESEIEHDFSLVSSIIGDYKNSVFLN